MEKDFVESHAKNSMALNPLGFNPEMPYPEGIVAFVILHNSLIFLATRTSLA